MIGLRVIYSVSTSCHDSVELIRVSIR